MLFSTNRRDRATYADAAWAKRDRPPWLPEPIATVLLDNLDWPLWAVYAAVAVVATGLFFIVREIVDCYRWERSRAATRALVREEAARKLAAQRQQPSKAVTTALSGGPLVRWCRYCDVVIEDAHAAAHEAGKRHRKLAGAKAECCWVWREAPPSAAPIEEPVDTNASKAPLGAVVAPSVARSGGGDGGKGAWQTSKKRK